MKLREIADRLGLLDLTPQLSAAGEADVTGGHVSDLLSDVLANAPGGGVLVTIQSHMNVIAVAVHADLKAVIFASGRRPEDAVISKAVESGIRLYVSKEHSFTVVGRLYGLGLRGRNG